MSKILIIFLGMFTNALFAQPCNVGVNELLQGECTYVGTGKIGVNVEITCNYSDGKLHGAYTERHLYSKFNNYECFYTDGLMNGIEREYSSRNKVFRERTYLNGILNGPVIYYDYKGTLLSEEFYENGQPTGRWRSFHKNGRVRVFFDCHNGECGDIRHFDRKGRLTKLIIKGSDGLRHKTIHYDKHGNVTKEEIH